MILAALLTGPRDTESEPVQSQVLHYPVHLVGLVFTTSTVSGAWGWTTRLCLGFRPRRRASADLRRKRP